MSFIKGCCVLLIICATFAQDISEHEEGKNLQDYNQNWKAVDSSGPSWPTDSDEQPLKRRRIRKRKRRPPVFEEESEEVIPRRRIRPQRLDQIKEPWEAISEDLHQTQKSSNRRRLTPIYDETQEVMEPKPQTYERIRDPFTALQEAEEKQKTKVEDNAPDLKTILKQSGGLSLSEVLQEKNLTLSELLKGNRHAISALVREAETTTTAEVVTSTESLKYRRLPPSIGLKKDISRNFARDSNDRLTSHEVMEAQRKRLALLHTHKDTKMFPDVTKFDVVTEETTEKRLFVPSNPKFYTSVDYKMSTEARSIMTTSATTTTTVSPNLNMRNLPMTSAKLNKMVVNPGHETTPQIPQKAVPIDLNEIFGFGTLGKKSVTESDGPFKMVIDLGGMTTEIPQDSENEITQTTTAVKVPEVATTTMTSLSEKSKHVTAQEEIMEILKNPREREHLSRILRTRNMTVEELVEQRERGSSQLHLADIFHNKTREPEPKEEHVGQIQSNYGDFSVHNRRGKTIPIVSEAVSSTQPTLKLETTTKFPYTITSFPTYKIETNKATKAEPLFPIWQQLYPNFFQNGYNDNHQKSSVQSTTPITEKLNYEELDRLEEIENALAEAANERFKVDVPHNVYEDDEEEFINLPSGVKSAILASLAIIGLSLLVFLTILLIFKWSQKKKARLNYNGSFSGSKIRSPILEPHQRRTFRTFVSETLGRKKNYYKAHLQSMSDTIWDKEEKKSYMI